MDTLHCNNTILLHPLGVLICTHAQGPSPELTVLRGAIVLHPTVPESQDISGSAKKVDEEIRDKGRKIVFLWGRLSPDRRN